MPLPTASRNRGCSTLSHRPSTTSTPTHLPKCHLNTLTSVDFIGLVAPPSAYHYIWHTYKSVTDNVSITRE